MPDICDMDELAHGERREGLFTAVQSFINKAESWVIGLCGGILLSLAGFDPNLTQQTPETFNHMLWLALTPLIFFTAVAVVIAWFLPFSAEVMEDVHAKLAVHHAAAAAAKDLGPNPATS
jgi:GPH family glycoside/pentoside/hexuronide:cation symporter